MNQDNTPHDSIMANLARHFSTRVDHRTITMSHTLTVGMMSVVVDILASGWASRAGWSCKTGWFEGTGLGYDLGPGCDLGPRHIAEEGGEPEHTEREPAVPDIAGRDVRMGMAEGMGSRSGLVPETLLALVDTALPAVVRGPATGMPADRCTAGMIEVQVLLVGR